LFGDYKMKSILIAVSVLSLLSSTAIASNKKKKKKAKKKPKVTKVKKKPAKKKPAKKKPSKKPSTTTSTVAVLGGLFADAVEDAAERAHERRLEDRVYKCEQVNAYCFMGIVLEEKEWDDGFFTSDFDEALDDADDILEDCLSGKEYGLNNVMECINGDVRPGYELNRVEVCGAAHYEELRSVLESDARIDLSRECE
jgi:hypothetical protein